ncbi:MT-A70/Methyltransferase [Cladophialophora carrionii]|uniref:MT-A70/Methyltransferase n=1 Tax=Cladophialophora carrionii TaxID=86049 RepID=A0A1C1C7L7_9EURO|nr:MT-A70/Methyltransferase [Cladophialophora carrionii]
MQPTILSQNEAGTVYLVDLPTSIQNGQDALHALKSSEPLESPYPSTEPKGANRVAALAAISLNERSYHESVQESISRALAEIRTRLHATGQGGIWCYARRALITHAAPELSNSNSPSAAPVILSTTELRTQFSSFRDFSGSVVCNLRSAAAVVAVTSHGDFVIPPRSTFILASLEQGLSALLLAREYFLRDCPDFDLILMDPPWSNRSVRHAGAYRTQENQVQDPFDEALRIVKRLCAPQGWIAVWITNKSSIRAMVLETLQAMDLRLQEEWIWIKTTIHGEPVTQLDGVWRRPYEMLLLFQRGASSENTKRRIIAAVPDVHSRKPCLKMLLQELLPPEYRALELFARSLTAGWWSWGDEVLKFQHESQWAYPFSELSGESPL